MKKLISVSLFLVAFVVANAQTDRQQDAGCAGYSCWARCLFGGCSACCPAGAGGGAVCGCPWGVPVCGCGGGGSANRLPTQTIEQKENVSAFVARIANFRSPEGRQIISLLTQITDLFGGSETLEASKVGSYDALQKQYESLINNWSGAEKDLFVSYYNEAKAIYDARHNQQ